MTGWDQHQMFVLSELKRISSSIERTENTLLRMAKRQETRLDKHDCRLGSLERDAAALGVRASIYGALAGAIPGAVGVLALVLKVMG